MHVSSKSLYQKILMSLLVAMCKSGFEITAIELACSWAQSSRLTTSVVADEFLEEGPVSYAVCEICAWPAYVKNVDHTECDKEYARIWRGDGEYEDLEEMYGDRVDIEEVEDEDIPPKEVYNRAYRHFSNHELAREASEITPGDFI